MWASAWHLASWCLDWTCHLLHGGRQVENLLTLSSILNSLSKVRIFHGWFHSCGCQNWMWRRILCFMSSAPLKIPIYMFSAMRKLCGLQNRHLLLLGLLSYTFSV